MDGDDGSREGGGGGGGGGAGVDFEGFGFDVTDGAIARVVAGVEIEQKFEHVLAIGDVHQDDVDGTVVKLRVRSR